MTRNKKEVFFITMCVTTLVVLTVLLALRLNLQAFKPRIESAASKALGMEVRIKGRLGLALSPGLSISLKDISVRNGGSDVVTVEKMRIGLKLAPLARREVRLSRVALIKPVFSIVRYKNGVFNFDKPGRAQSGRPLAMEKISISEGRLVYTDERSGDRMEVDDFDVTIRNLSYGGTEGAKLVEPPPAGAGGSLKQRDLPRTTREPPAGAGGFQVAGLKNISFAGDIGCKTLLINNFTLKNFVMIATAKSGMLDINPVSMNLFGATGKGSIHLDMRGASPHYRITATLNRFRIEKLIAAFQPGDVPRKSIEGTVSFSANLNGKGINADELKRSLNGDLFLNGEDLILTSIDIDALIPKYERSQNFNLVDVGSYFLAGPFGPLLTKSYNFASLYRESRVGRRNIPKIVSIWNVKNGIAWAIDVAFATNINRIAVKGGLNFIDYQFDDITVAVLDKRGCAVYSQKVRGPFNKPKVEKVNIFKSLTGPVSNALKGVRRFFNGEKCEVFYSGSVPQP